MPIADAGSATSDALFVGQPSPIVSIGDRVRITGEVRQYAARQLDYPRLAA